MIDFKIRLICVYSQEHNTWTLYSKSHTNELKFTFSIS